METVRRKPIGRPRRAVVLATALVFFLGSDLVWAGGSERRLIVKYRSEGPHAVEACAEGLSRSGRPFSAATRDASDSLDQIHLRYSLHSARALLRAGRRAATLEARRAALAERFAASAVRRSGGERPRELPDLAHVYRVTVPRGDELSAALAALEADPHVEWAQPDHEYRLDQNGPVGVQGFDDPFLSSAGAWGQPFADLWGIHRIGAPAVWPLATGEGVVVAVVDSGLDRFHPDIAANVWVNPGEDLNGNGRADAEDLNGLDDDENGFIDDLTGFDFANSVDADEDGSFDGPDDVSDADPFDDNGHGTHVAGTIAAVGDNGIGIAGVAPRARIMAVKGFPAAGSASDSVLWRAVLYAAENGARVINNSWSCGRPCPDNPLANEVLAHVEAMGVSVVTSAGNRSDDVLFYNPENGPIVLTVGSVGVDDSISSFSNTGWLVDVVAPGGGPELTPPSQAPRRNILSLLSSGTREEQLAFAVAGQYLRLAGTSMSSPHVAGAVALLRGVRPDLTPGDVRRAIRLAAEDLGEPGPDPISGPGLLDLPKLLTMPLPKFELEIESPKPAEIHDPARGPVLVRGRASGSDLVDYEVSVAPGLSGRRFAALDEATPAKGGGGRSTSPPDLLARWNVSTVPDGPYVLRARARLSDGRIADDYTILGLERNAPSFLSDTDLDDGRPALTGRSVFWHRDENDESSQVHDLFAGRFPTRRERDEGIEPSSTPVLELEGDQRNVVAAGFDLAWSTRDAGVSVIEYCRLWPTKGRCEPQRATNAAGDILRPWLGGGWLLWTRFEGAQRVVEGCPLGRGPAPTCDPRPVVDPSAGSGFTLEAYDGEWLLLRRAASLSRCRIEKTTGLCVPVPITFARGAGAPIEPALDGDLLAFRRFTIESLLPPGCEEDDSRPECVAADVLVVELAACWIEGATQQCDPVAISEKTRSENLQGVAVSGRRIAWAAGDAFERPSIRFCELVRETGECALQRVTGTPAATGFPALAGDRLVWEDGRTGSVSIAAFALPRLSESRGRTVRAGEPFALVLRGDPGFADSLHPELEVLAGPSLEAARVELTSIGEGGRIVKIRGRFPSTAAGSARWQLRARTDSGLFTDRILDFEILPALGRKN